MTAPSELDDAEKKNLLDASEHLLDRSLVSVVEGLLAQRLAAIAERLSEVTDNHEDVHAATCAITEDWSNTFGDGFMPNECTCWQRDLKTLAGDLRV